MFIHFKNLLDKLSIKLNLSKKNSPSNNGSINNSPSSQINTAGRDIVNNHISTLSEMPSDQEMKILLKLYKEYRDSGKLFRWKTVDAHNELGIGEEMYVGHLSGSRFLKLDSEYYLLNDDGIRFMDNYIRDNQPNLVLDFSYSRGTSGKAILLGLSNDGKGPALNINAYLNADELTGETNSSKASVKKLSQGETLPYLIKVDCMGTDFINKELSNPRLVLEYKDSLGFVYQNRRELIQKLRSDGQFNLEAGDKF